VNARPERWLPWALVGLAVVVWLVPLQSLWWDSTVISDIPTYERAYELMRAGELPYVDFPLEYPPLAALVFLIAGLVPGSYAAAFSGLMLLCLCATVLGVTATARALGFPLARQAVAGGLVAVSPLVLGNLMETRFDLALAALLSWMLWALVTGRFPLAWGLLAAATLLKLVPLALVPAMLVFQRHREGLRPALRGLGFALGAIAVVALPFVVLSPSGTWDIVGYHAERPLQIESTGSAYLLSLRVLADIDLTVNSSFGSQGLKGNGPDAIALLSTVATVVLLAAILITFTLLLRRARPPADARLLVAAVAATTAALLVGGKVLSPQFLVWLLPSAFLVAGRRGWGALGAAVAAMVVTQVYFPSRYWDLVALDHGVIGLLVLRDALLVVLLVLAWPRPATTRPSGATLPHRADPAPAGSADRAVAARYLSG
jgi:hypothetical protein